MSEAADDHALVLQISADNQKMLRAFETAVAKIDQFAGTVEKRTKKMADQAENAFSGQGFGKALDKVFDSSRLAVLEEGATKIRIFGSALEPLGALGIGAAAGIAALGLAMETTEKAVDYAAGIAKLSHELGVSTDFIQEFNFAAKQTEVDVGQADGAIKALAASLGQVQAGLARKQTLKAWQALFGEDPQATLEHFKNVGDLLPVLSEKMAAIGNAAEQAAIAKRLGIEALLPMLQKGSDNFAELAKRAQALGVVMDAATIQKGEAAKEKLNELDQVMQAKTLITFAQFSDTLIKLKTFLLDVETAFLHLVSVLTNTQPDSDKLAHLVAQRASLVADQARTHITDPERLAVLDRQIAELKAKVDANAKTGQTAPPGGKPPKALVDPTGGHTKTDPTSELDKAATDAYQSGLKALNQAQAALLVDIQARAEAEKRAIDADTTKKLADLSAEEAKIRASKNDVHRAEQLALIEKAKTEEQNAAAAKKEKIDRDAREAIRKQQLEFDQVTLAGQEHLLQLQQNLTANDAARYSIALQLLDLAYRREKAELEGVIASETASAADKELARLKLKQLQAEQPALRATAGAESSPGARAGAAATGRPAGYIDPEKDHRDALAQIQREAQAGIITEQEAANAKKRIDQELYATKLQMASDFFGSLAGLSDSSNKTLAAIGKAAAITQATIDGVLAVQKALSSAAPPYNFVLAATVGTAAAINVAKIAGLADGGAVVGPGGPRDDKVLRWLSNGEHVVNAQAASRPGVRTLLDQINAGRDLRALLPQPSVAAVAPPSQAMPAAGAGDFHLHYAPNITNPDPDLMRLIERQPRALKRAVGELIRNREIQAPRN